VIPDAPWRVVIVSQVPMVASGYAELVRALGHEPVALLAGRFPAQHDSPRARVFAGGLVMESPRDLDLVYPGGKERLAPVLRSYEPDLLLCTAFPLRIPADALAVPTVGCVNGHPSLLPRFRGPSPMGWAVREGEDEIGMTFHLMDETFDTGGILAQKAVPVDDDESMETLWPKLGAVAGELLPVVFDRLARGDRGDPQEGGDYQSLFEDDYAFVDPSQTAAEVHRQVRAWRLTPIALNERGAILERDGKRLRLMKTSLAEVEGAERLDCADGPLWIVESEPADPPQQ
jgi:methionyl-tRNA formyltransferase